MHSTFKEVLELDDFIPELDKSLRPLNGQYACDLSPETINIINARKEASLKIIQDRKDAFQAAKEDAKTQERATKKLRNDQLKKPTIDKRDADILELRRSAAQEKLEIVSANKNIAAILSKAAKDSKSNTAKKAKEDNTKNLKAAKARVTKDMNEKIAEVNKNAKIQITRILMVDNGHIEIEADDDNDNEGDNDNDNEVDEDEEESTDGLLYY
jgi:hypothetical protein